MSNGKAQPARRIAAVIPVGAPGAAAAAQGSGQVAQGRERTLREQALRGSALGLLVSVLIHSVFLRASALLLFQVARVGTARDSGGETMQVSIVAGEELEEIRGASLDVAAPRIGDTTALADLPAGPPLEGPRDSDREGIDGGGDLSGAIDALRGTGAGVGGDGSGLGSGGTGGGAASFFGVEAKGSRFAFICDISGSMRGEKLDALKVELNETIGGMMEHMQFFVCFFSHEAYPMGGRAKWTAATDDGKRWAAARIREVESQGGTVPDGAFELVFGMRPRPDAIYFMTDGLFDPGVAEKVAWLNRAAGRKVPVHCLAFVDRSSEGTMREIAERSGGTYTYIEGPRRKR
jgi:hypothetical protein